MRYTEKMNLENEEWRPIAGYEGLYFVSNYGRVKSHYRHGYNCVPNEGNVHLLKLVRHDNGYLYVSLCKDKSKKAIQVHRLVATAFLNLEGKMAVNHIDGNKENNHVSNLEVVTHSENVNHAIKTGLMDGEMHEPRPIAILKDGKEVGQFPSVKSLCEAYGLSHSAVVRVTQGKAKQHKGYTFKYL